MILLSLIMRIKLPLFYRNKKEKQDYERIRMMIYCTILTRFHTIHGIKVEMLNT